MHELIRGLGDAQLRQRPIPDKWSPFEQLAHLVAYQPVFLRRMQLVEQQHEPSFERYVADTDPAFLRCVEQPLRELEDDLTTQRFIIYNHISRLPETTLRRTALHPLYGALSIVQWTEFFLLHEAHHLFAVFRLTTGLRKSQQ